MDKTIVVNKKNKKFDIYIGRGSKWGNPFIMKDYSEKERNRVCDEYISWFWEQFELIKSLPELRGKILGCYCSPKRCHGDFLCEVLNNNIKNEKEYFSYKNIQNGEE